MTNSSVVTSTSLKKDGNMALHIQDAPSKVVQNRIKFLSTLGINIDTLVCMNQTHSSNIKVITSQDASRGSLTHENAIENCDALITNQRNITLAVMTADCVPVMIWNESAGIIAAVHAGWRGTANSIVSKTVSKIIEEFGVNADTLNAIIGPSISECCYEVGDETAALCGCAGAKRLNLKQLTEVQLISSGLLLKNISTSNDCTSCWSNKYYSYRADGPQTGRFMSIITIQA